MGGWNKKETAPLIKSFIGDDDYEPLDEESSRIKRKERLRKSGAVLVVALTVGGFALAGYKSAIQPSPKAAVVDVDAFFAGMLLDDKGFYFPTLSSTAAGKRAGARALKTSDAGGIDGLWSFDWKSAKAGGAAVGEYYRAKGLAMADYYRSKYASTLKASKADATKTQAELDSVGSSQWSYDWQADMERGVELGKKYQAIGQSIDEHYRQVYDLTSAVDGEAAQVPNLRATAEPYDWKADRDRGIAIGQHYEELGEQIADHYDQEVDPTAVDAPSDVDWSTQWHEYKKKGKEIGKYYREKGKAIKKFYKGKYDKDEYAMMAASAASPDVAADTASADTPVSDADVDDHVWGLDWKEDKKHAMSIHKDFMEKGEAIGEYYRAKFDPTYASDAGDTDVAAEFPPWGEDPEADKAHGKAIGQHYKMQGKEIGKYYKQHGKDIHKYYKKHGKEIGEYFEDYYRKRFDPTYTPKFDADSSGSKSTSDDQSDITERGISADANETPSTSDEPDDKVSDSADVDPVAKSNEIGDSASDSADAVAGASLIDEPEPDAADAVADGVTEAGADIDASSRGSKSTSDDESDITETGASADANETPSLRDEPDDTVSESTDVDPLAKSNEISDSADEVADTILIDEAEPDAADAVADGVTEAGADEETPEPSAPVDPNTVLAAMLVDDKGFDFPSATASPVPEPGTRALKASVTGEHDLWSFDWKSAKAGGAAVGEYYRAKGMAMSDYYRSKYDPTYKAAGQIDASKADASAEADSTWTYDWQADKERGIALGKKYQAIGESIDEHYRQVYDPKFAQDVVAADVPILGATAAPFDWMADRDRGIAIGQHYEDLGQQIAEHYDEDFDAPPSIDALSSVDWTNQWKVYKEEGREIGRYYRKKGRAIRKFYKNKYGENANYDMMTAVAGVPAAGSAGSTASGDVPAATTTTSGNHAWGLDWMEDKKHGLALHKEFMEKGKEIGEYYRAKYDPTYSPDAIATSEDDAGDNGADVMDEFPPWGQDPEADRAHGKAIGQYYKNRGKAMGRYWKEHGKDIHEAYKEHGKDIGKYFEDYYRSRFDPTYDPEANLNW